MSGSLPGSFRKRDLAGRRAAVTNSYPRVTESALGTDPEMNELADVMVESAVGYLALPLGVAVGFVVDGEVCDVPLATEEPSVIAACGYAASIVGREGGFATRPGEAITTGQIFVEGATRGAEQRIAAAEATLRETASPLLERMTRRGGGWRGMTVTPLAGTSVLKVSVDLDARDAMGANIVNSVAEAIRPAVESLSGGSVVMAILSNAAHRRATRSRFSVAVSRLARAGRSGEDVARRIVSANRIALADPTRAVTHNKGIMNGVTSLALATGNDTRALEAAVHEFASRDGTYRALTRYRTDGERLSGEITIPVPLGTVGGAAGIHPTSAAALEMLGGSSLSASRLASIAASVGLAQNFAALFALVSEGIQRGHMGLHANRIAWAAGARGPERAAVVAAMKARHEYGTGVAEEVLARLRAAGGPGTA